MATYLKTKHDAAIANMVARKLKIPHENTPDGVRLECTEQQAGQFDLEYKKISGINQVAEFRKVFRMEIGNDHD